MDVTTCPHCGEPLSIGAQVTQSGAAFIDLSADGSSASWSTEPRWEEMQIETVYCDSCGEDLPDEYLEAIRALLN
jgi:uncharacterized protein (UPF0212 family)